MPALGFRSIATLIIGLLAGCSGGDFELASTTQDASSDGGAGSETSVTEGGAGSDAGSPDAAPACNTTVPALTCAGGAYEPQFDLAGTIDPATPRISHSVSHAISFIQTNAGRTEKIALRLRRSDAGTGVDGQLTINVFYVPCENQLVPISSTTRPAAEIAGDTSFYFTGPFGSGAQYLPFLPKGSRLLFVIGTTSTRYTWEHATAPRAADDPRGFRFYTKVGTAEWSEAPNRVAAAMSYLRACGL
ncbi:MAG: hypothetical protein HYV09_25745 [Deltaproteobacteria bacterium]|nr:hypothetical protein [Deltaproteobacteria bacterium]